MPLIKTAECDKATEIENRSVPRKLFIKTYGCQMNVYDSARMAELLAPMGYRETSLVGEADLVILNTCHIREKAAEKVYSELGRLNRLRRKKASSGGRMMIAVAGCVAQAEGEELRRRAPYVDIVFGPQTYHRLPEMVARIEAGRDDAVIDTEFPVESKFDFLPEELNSKGASAFLAVQEGCDKFCSFCVVPYTRGAEYSRPVSDIVRDARNLVAGGAREIVLLGQNVNAYHGLDAAGRPSTLSRLIYALADVPGLMRLRYTTSHPLELGEDLIAAHRDVPILMPFLHLPVQSGSDRVLRLMQRRHTGDHYRRLVDKLRAAKPDLAIASDFIVGFPGETEADAAILQDFLVAARLDAIGIFGYSDEDGTEAAGLPGKLADDEIASRVEDLADLADSLMAERATARVGTSVDVLIDEVLADGGYLGRAEHQAPEVDGSTEIRSGRRLAVGDLVEAVVTGSEGVDLYAALAGDAGER